MSRLEDTIGQQGLVWTQRTLITVYASVMAVMVAGCCFRVLQIPCQVKSIKRGDNCLHFAPAATAAARSSVGISDCRNTTTQICFL